MPVGEVVSPAAPDPDGGVATGAGVTGTVYPLITAVAPGGPVRTASPEAAAGRRTEIVLERLADGLPVLADRLERELRDGGCALVVRNTVARVLDTARVLRERFGDGAVTVAHSRFVAADRARNDAELRERFGPDSETRPAGPHVVVASQVVEQSLDVDFDLLVTDLAPVDLALQRMGRLHRHPRPRPTPLRRARCLVTGVDWRTDPPRLARGSIAVYRAHHLLRALAVLGPHLDGAPLVLPKHISPLVQEAYGKTPVGPESWAPVLDKAASAERDAVAEQRERAEPFRLGPVRPAGRPIVGWLYGAVGDTDESRTGRAQVRDTRENLEVLLVQRCRDGRLRTLSWLEGGRGGLSLPEHMPPPRWAAEAVAASALTLPAQFCNSRTIDRTLDELERFHVPAWQSTTECPWLAGELILVLDEECQTRLAGFDVRYSRADGLLVGPFESPPTQEVESMRRSFDLITRPWLTALRTDGEFTELSLTEVFARAGEIRRLVGDLPTQELALLRLLLAILHDAVDGPVDQEDWERLWQAKDPFGGVPEYLERHRERFDLLHPEQPFFQVAGLHTAKHEVSPLNRIVADVPSGEAFFSMRRPGADRLGLAEAARWVVHAHAFDVSGIKSGMVDDSRVKSGKVYPQGVGWTGNLGGVFAEGDTLRDTLLLNLIPYEVDILRPGRGALDRPIWRRQQPGPGAVDLDEEPETARPTGPRDLYTWQSRRMLLHTEGEEVTGVVLGYGDPLTAHNRWDLEPMTGWRRSPAQERKHGLKAVHMPLQHDPSRAAWWGLEAVLPHLATGADSGRDVPERRTSGVVRWLAMLANEGELPAHTLLRTRAIGAVYGTQQSVVDEVVDDEIPLPVILLHEEYPQYGTLALDAVRESEQGVRALGQLAGNLARAAGSDPAAPSTAARDRGYGALDGPYRRWLAGLAAVPSPERARDEWRRTARRILTDLGRELLDTAGDSAETGRLVEHQKTKRWVDAARAELWFLRDLNGTLPRPGSRFATDPA
ncbi:type I-E CRISPR-associated protein Cse1/CasA [Streptomyces sp. AJS327]|nr:type I-E CRISPR-associated protein Cse1/CasA [Streptomyces sp. AJS327]